MNVEQGTVRCVMIEEMQCSLINDNSLLGQQQLAKKLGHRAAVEKIDC